MNEAVTHLTHLVALIFSGFFGGVLVAGVVFYRFTIGRKANPKNDPNRAKSNLLPEDTDLTIISRDMRRLLEKKERALTPAEYMQVTSFVCDRGQRLIDETILASAELFGTEKIRCVAVDVLSRKIAFGQTCLEAADTLKQSEPKSQVYAADIDERLNVLRPNVANKHNHLDGKNSKKK